MWLGHSGISFNHLEHSFYIISDYGDQMTLKNIDSNLIGHIYLGMQSIYQKWNNVYIVINQMLIITVVASYFRGQILDKNSIACMKYIH